MTALCGQTLLAANMQPANDAPHTTNPYNTRSRLVKQLCGIYNRTTLCGDHVCQGESEQHTWRPNRFAGFQRRRTKSDLEQYLDNVELDAATEQFCDGNIGDKSHDGACNISALIRTGGFVDLNDTAPFLPELIDDISLCFDSNKRNRSMSAANKRIYSKFSNVSVLERCAQFEHKTPGDDYHSELDSSSAVSSLHSSQCGTVTSEDYYYLDERNISSDSSSRPATKDEFCVARQQKRRKRRLRSQSLGPRRSHSYDRQHDNHGEYSGFHYSASSSSTETLLNDHNKSTAVSTCNDPIDTSLHRPGGSLTAATPDHGPTPGGNYLPGKPTGRAATTVSSGVPTVIETDRVSYTRTTRSASVANADLNSNSLLATPCLKGTVAAASRRSNSVSSWLQRQSNVNSPSPSTDDHVRDALSNSNNNTILSSDRDSGKTSLPTTRNALAGIDVVNLTKMESVEELIKSYCSGVSDSEDSLLSAASHNKSRPRQQQQQQHSTPKQQQQQHKVTPREQSQQQQSQRRRVGRSHSFAAATKLSDQRRITTRLTMPQPSKASQRHNDELPTRVVEQSRTTGQTNGKDQYRRVEKDAEKASTTTSELASRPSPLRVAVKNDSIRVDAVHTSERRNEATNREGTPTWRKTATLGLKGATKESTSSSKANVIVLQGFNKKCTNGSDDQDDCSTPGGEVTNYRHSEQPASKVVQVDGVPTKQIHCGDLVRLEVSVGSTSTTPDPGSTSLTTDSSTRKEVVEVNDNICVSHYDAKQQTIDVTGECEEGGQSSALSVDLEKYLNYHPDIAGLRKELNSTDFISIGNPSCVSCSSLANCLAQLKMDNARLQQLLYDVEQARSGTVKALLQANTLLQNVQNDNTMLQGQVRVIEQEKTYLQQNLRNIKESKSNQDVLTSSAGDALDGSVPTTRIHPEFDGSLKAIAETWRKEKREMMKSLAATTSRAETAEKDAERLRIQFKKVKEQLEQSNEAYSTLLKSNSELTNKFDDQFKILTTEKDNLLCRIEKGEIVGKDFELQRSHIEELTASLEETQDERDNLQRQVSALEKQKRAVLMECDELHEQLDHCEELMEKMTETEEQLKARLEKETGEKTYLQGCLDETGRILLHLRTNERQLKEEKDLLEEDLETEIQQKQSLKQTLQKTTQEHKDICTELEEMSNIHVTVRESLQQAGKKEKNYQQQIEELTRTNHILHYSLEKEKEEGNDLQVMFDCLEIELKLLKRDSSSEIKTLTARVEELSAVSEDNGERLKVAEKQCGELRNNLEQEEEDNDGLRKSNARLENLRASQETELSTVREKRNDLENEVLAIKRQAHDFKKSYDSQLQLNEDLQDKLRKTDDNLTKTSRELSDLQETLHKREFEMEETKARMKSKQKKIQEMDNDLTDATQAKVRFETRLRGFEKETKELRGTVQEQNEELSTLRFEVKRVARERDVSKREAETSKSEFDYHKSKCSETMKSLRDEIISLQNRLMSKDRFTMKQKESFQDTIDNATNDLALFRQFMADEVSISHSNGDSPRVYRSDDEVTLSEREKFDLQYFKGVNEKYRREMQAQVNNLEGMLEMSKQRSDCVTVVQSPMSKLKLEEIKKLREDIHQLGREAASMRTRLRSAYEEIMIVKLSLEPVNDVVPSASEKAKLIARSVELERHLVNLDNAIYEIENQHKTVVKNNLTLLDRIGTTTGERATSETGAAVPSTSMREENLKLKTLLRMLKRKYNFEENEVWVEGVRNLQSSRLSRDQRKSSDASTGQRGYESECSTGSDSISESNAPRTTWRERRALRERTSNGMTSESGTQSPRLTSRRSDLNDTRSTDEGANRRSSLAAEETASDRESGLVESERPKLTHRTSATITRNVVDDDDFYDPPPGELKRSSTLPIRSRPRGLR